MAKMTVNIPSEWRARRTLMNNLKAAGDAAHQRGRKAEQMVRFPFGEGVEPNETQRATLEFASDQRTLGDVLHELATQIERS